MLKFNLVAFYFLLVPCCHIYSCFDVVYRPFSSRCFSCILLAQLSDWGTSCQERTVQCPFGLLDDVLIDNAVNAFVI